ncbi:novN [Symbiodinium pilosum]|uniref:NovN protein n=1 Tax=Symbiodinium pilosum TaxID=2952 RepID=A0A812NMX7_SYMPI|nr:novN [Symbiodinium pilosum]
MGGLGVRSAERTAPAAYWAAWADALVPLRDRLPEGADGYTEPLEAGGGHATCLQDAAEARRTLQGERWADCPTWRVVFEGQFARAASETSAGGWQGHATRIQTKYYRDRAGPQAGMWFTAIPAEAATTLPPQAMLVALRRRQRLALPLCPLHVCFLVMHVLVVLSYLANMFTSVAWL